MLLKDGNTALHWAAATGLKRCVELLVSQQNAALFIENNEKMTPCDLAMKSNHHDIARLLEARMVFVSILTFFCHFFYLPPKETNFHSINNFHSIQYQFQIAKSAR